jgi:hypothetical protein
MNQSKEEKEAITLPKLIKDKIDDYKTLLAVNTALDEMFERTKKRIKEINKRSQSKVELVMCNGYDIVDGKKKHCMKMEIITHYIEDGPIDKKNRVYCCWDCNKGVSYCKEHAVGKLYNNNDVIVCENCIDHEYEVGDNIEDA